MTRRIETAPTFERDLKRLGRRYRGIRQDLEPVLARLVAGELPGDRVRGVQAIVYKARVPNSDAGRGKSGGYRVIYYLPIDDLIILLSIYSKADQADIAAAEIRRIFGEELGG